MDLTTTGGRLSHWTSVTSPDQSRTAAANEIGFSAVTSDSKSGPTRLRKSWTAVAASRRCESLCAVPETNASQINRFGPPDDRPPYQPAMSKVGFNRPGHADEIWESTHADW